MTMVSRALAIPGWMTDTELAWLACMARQLAPGAVWAEVGTWMGRSWTAAALSLPARSTIISVDTFLGEHAEPLAYVREHGTVMPEFIRAHEAVRAVRPDIRSVILAMHSIDAAPYVADQSCDVVFVDGDHRAEFIRADIMAWLPKVKRGGLLCGHDCDDPGVRAGLEGIWLDPMDPPARGSIWCHKTPGVQDP